MNKIEKADYIFKCSSNGYENFLQKTNTISDKTKEILFQNLGPRKGTHFMNCLHKHYTDDEIMELFYSIENDNIKSNLVQNTMNIFKSLPSSLVCYEFIRVNNDFTELHNEFNRLKSMKEDWVNPHKKISPYFTANNIDYAPNGII